VEKPLPPVNVAPLKLIAVTEVATELSLDKISTPETTPLKFEPSPEKEVAVTTPVTLTPVASAVVIPANVADVLNVPTPVILSPFART